MTSVYISVRYSEALTIEQLHNTHNLRLLKLAEMYCGCHQVAQDAVQETWIRAWRHLDSLRQNTSVKSWLIQIMKREVARIYAKQKGGHISLAEEACKESTQDKTLENIQLKDIFKQLSKQESKLLQLAGEGITHAQIAEQLNISANAVTIRLHRARKKAIALNAA